MSRKFIPNGDSKFANMARGFAKQVTQRAAVYGLSEDEAQEVARAVVAFRDAMAVNYNRVTRSMATVARKDETRAEAERLIRRAVHLMRANPQLSAADKVRVGLKDRPSRLRRRECPQTSPAIHFLTDVHGSLNRGGKHVISFRDRSEKLTRSKPEGAVRMELFVDLVPLGEPIPSHPGQRHGGMMWYLRSYTRSPIKVEYPKSEVPMRVVYWGCWASATGETGPFSKPLAAPIEATDWSQFALPAPAAAPVPALPNNTPEPRRLEQKVIITSARRELPDRVETIDTLHAESSRILPDEPAEKLIDAA